jgi:hypothetical protein
LSSAALDFVHALDLREVPDQAPQLADIVDAELERIE